MAARGREKAKQGSVTADPPIDRPLSSDRWLAVAAAIPVLVGLAAAAFFMFAAWDHNPQGEFHELAPNGTTIVHWADWLPIGVEGFAAGAGASCFALGI